MIILSASAATDEFVQQFNDEPEEKDEPGYFTDNLFAIAPVILDNTGLLGQALATGGLPSRHRGQTCRLVRGRRTGRGAGSGSSDSPRPYR
jgi:hypothetical protein